MCFLHVFFVFSLYAGASAVRILDSDTHQPREFVRRLGPELSDGQEGAFSTGAGDHQLFVFWAVAILIYAMLVSIVFYGARQMFGKEAQSKQQEGTSGEKAAELADSSSEESDEELDDGNLTRETKFTVKTILRKETTEKGEKEKVRRRAYKTQWLRASHAVHLKEGALTLIAVTTMMIWYRLVRMLIHPASIPAWHWSANVAEFLLLALVLAGNIFCWKHPSDIVYWPLFVFYCFYVPAVTLPPFQWSCEDLENAAEGIHPGTDWYLHEAKADMDCSMQGLTAQELFMASILTLPWLVPRQKMLKTFGFLWLLGVYLPWSLAYSKLTSEGILSKRENLLRLVILAITLMIAWLKKFYLEKNARNNFVMVFRRREAGKKMYDILSYMLPNHVIVPMLENPNGVVAEHCPRVSILFIVIADFDEFARRSTPKDLLQFLNSQFTKFDQLCAQHGVTKIETVGEEYVCCVGVAPEEQSLEHKDILQRLFSVADSILKLQSTSSSSSEQTEVRVKMGLHTGPIVAGVIGKKLPRYRLFGDTINTAARMMQKSEVGKLQFGEETFKDLPSAVEYKERGEIEMKGKGLVKTYFFEQSGEKQETDSLKPATAKRRTICALLNENQNLDDVSEPTAPEQCEAPFDVSSAANLTGSLTDFLSGTGTLQRARADFEEVLRQVTLQDFTPDMEKAWFEDYHKKVICKKFDGRLNRFLIGLLLITAVEGGYVIWRQEFDHEGSHGEYCFRTFFGLRALPIFILMFWRMVIVPRDLHVNSPFLVHSGLTASTVIILVMIWFSYEALTTTENSARQPHKHEGFSNVFKAPLDNIFVLNYVLVFYVAAALQHLLFKSSLIFVIQAVALCVVSYIRGDQGLDFPFLGKALFVAMAMSNSFHAYQAEKSSRERFKGWREVEGFKVRIENILNTLMPRQVVKELKSSPANEPPSHEYQHATIAQSDLCGFTKLASTRSPQEVVELIGDLFGAFDMLTDKHDVYKVETVGDAYIAGQAESTLTANKSPVSVILFGMDMAKAVDEWALLNKVSVRCRVGIHHGACIGGIVGNDMQRYHLFGDLMTGVEVLESTAPVGAVQVSSACKGAVEDYLSSQSFQEGSKELKLTDFVFEERTEPELMTSKGEVHAYAEVGGKTYIVSLTVG
mmetsp:Transcript_56212/g.103102  ORF Transcript_56212/g.103102 Transcript_56212/m.103102 type:complete len:1145 (+) Transcript_56212:54-3488(+)